jgi:hypothetical protein
VIAKYLLSAVEWPGTRIRTLRQRRQGADLLERGQDLLLAHGVELVFDLRCGRVEIEAKGVRHNIDFAVDHILQEEALKRSTEPSTVKDGTVVWV